MEIKKSLTINIPHETADTFKSMIQKISDKFNAPGFNTAMLTADELKLLTTLNEALEK